MKRKRNTEIIKLQIVESTIELTTNKGSHSYPWSKIHLSNQRQLCNFNLNEMKPSLKMYRAMQKVTKQSTPLVLRKNCVDLLSLTLHCMRRL